MSFRETTFVKDFCVFFIEKKNLSCPMSQIQRQLVLLEFTRPKQRSCDLKQGCLALYPARRQLDLDLLVTLRDDYIFRISKVQQGKVERKKYINISKMLKPKAYPNLHWVKGHQNALKMLCISLKLSKKKLPIGFYSCPRSFRGQRTLVKQSPNAATMGDIYQFVRSILKSY